MSDSTFHITKEDLRKPESRTSKRNDGDVPSDSNVAQMKSIIDQNSKPKSEIISERQANLPLPEDPPVASDWNSADATKVNVGSGGVESDISHGGGGDSLREPATSESGVRTDGEALGKNTSAPGTVGRQAVDGTEGLPKDATTGKVS